MAENNGVFQLFYWRTIEGFHGDRAEVIYLRPTISPVRVQNFIDNFF